MSLDLPSTAEIAKCLGGQVIGPGRVLAPGPGHSRHDRSLEILLKSDAPDGFLTHSHARDDALACKDYVRQVLGLEAWKPRRWIAPRQSRQETTVDEGQQQRIARAGVIWGEIAEPRGTVVERYPTSRGLALDDELAETIRFHRSHGMVALLRDIRTDEPCGVHRTYLDSSGRKVDRKMLGRAKGAAIKLDADAEVMLGLHIGEGVETCLTARQFGLQPVWALGSAGAIAEFPVLADLDALTILGERDEDGGENAANSLAVRQSVERYIAAGIEAHIIDPERGDFNDVIDTRAAS